MSQMLAGVNSIKAASQNIVNVSCLSTFAMRCLIPRLYRFSEQYPDIDIRLSTTSSDHVKQSNHDVVIGVSPRNVALGANQKVLFAEKIGPVMSPLFLTANTTLCAEKNIMDVSDMNGIAMLQTRTRMSIWDEWCQQVEHTLPMTSAGIFEHYYFTLEAVLSGLGACIVPQHLVVDDLNSQRLLAPLDFFESSYHYTGSTPPIFHH
jgi:DNA-binding transcriptional LysR family regulator